MQNELVNRAVKEEQAKPEEATDPDQWLETYGDTLFQYARARIKDISVAEDLVQETLLSGIKAYSKFEGRSSVKTWLVAIMRNKLIDHIRKESRKNTHVSTEDITEIPAIGFGSLGIWNVYVPDWAKSPDQTLEDKAFVEALHGCFDKLPKRYQQICQLKLLKDVSNIEACKVMNISPSNLWVLLHRTRLALRHCLEKNWYRKK